MLTKGKLFQNTKSKLINKHSKLFCAVSESYLSRYIVFQKMVVQKWLSRLNKREIALVKLAGVVVAVLSIYFAFIFPPMHSYSVAKDNNIKLKEKVALLGQYFDRFNRLQNTAGIGSDIILSMEDLDKRVRYTINSFVIKKAVIKLIKNGDERYMRMTWYKENVLEIFKVLDSVYAMGVQIAQLNYVSVGANRADVDVFLSL